MYLFNPHCDQHMYPISVTQNVLFAFISSLIPSLVQPVIYFCHLEPDCVFLSTHIVMKSYYMQSLVSIFFTQHEYLRFIQIVTLSTHLLLLSNGSMCIAINCFSGIFYHLKWVFPLPYYRLWALGLKDKW